MLDAISEDDLRDIVGAMVKKAKDGNVAAAKILLNRCLGLPVAADILERIEALEEREDLS